MILQDDVCKLFLDEHTAGVCLIDQAHQTALANRARGAAPWKPLLRGAAAGVDGDGDSLAEQYGDTRDFLDGRPVHCGSGLELQEQEYCYDDYGEYTLRLKSGKRVRYEMAGGKVVLFTTVGGFEFSKRADEWMRFRWPVQR